MPENQQSQSPQDSEKEAERQVGDADDLSEYTVEVNGVETTMMLSEEDAKRYDNAKKGSSSGSKSADAPANKSRSAEDK